MKNTQTFTYESSQGEGQRIVVAVVPKSDLKPTDRVLGKIDDKRVLIKVC